MPRQVDSFLSFKSTWAYMGHKLFREVASTYDLKVNHKPVVLIDLFSETGGLPLMKRHPVRQRYRMVQLEGVAGKRGPMARGSRRSRLAAIPIHFCAGPLRRCGKTS